MASTLAWQVEFTAKIIDMILAVNSTCRGLGRSACSYCSRKFSLQIVWGCGDDPPQASSISLDWKKLLAQRAPGSGKTERTARMPLKILVMATMKENFHKRFLFLYRECQNSAGPK